MRMKLYRAVLWAATLVTMAGIFAFSAQPGPSSDELTAAAVMPLAEIIASLQDNTAESTVSTLYYILGTFVRKLAHVCEYAFLGLLMHELLYSYGHRMLWLPILICVVYAMTDEIHQMFVPGRSGRVIDVLIDAVGVIAGVYAKRLLKRFSGKSMASR